MNILSKKAVAAVLVLSSMTVVSTSAQAEEASVDKVLARVVLNQGTRVMNDLSVQIQQSIQQSLSRFSIDAAASWFEASDVLTTKAKQQNNLTTPKSSEE